MRTITVGQNEAGQKLLKLLLKYLDKAPTAFAHKMLRKKNIVLNGKRADGSELLKPGDEVKLFLSEETIEGFKTCQTQEAQDRHPLKKSLIVYEDANVLIINKPFGVLSQRAERDDISLVEMLTDYLLAEGSLKESDLETFRPSVCNRLDRNTAGLVITGKSLFGLQTMTELIRDRKVRKFYSCIVKGTVPEKPQHIRGYLTKDFRTNRVTVSPVKRSDEDEAIETKYRATQYFDGYSKLEVELLTGKTHQIRAHLASTGHPIVGDSKYGDSRINAAFLKSCGLKHQLLAAVRLEFPKLPSELSALSEKKLRIAEPEIFSKVIAMIM